MAKKLRQDDLSVAEKLEGVLELMSWQTKLVRSALERIRNEAGPGSGRRGSGVRSRRRT